MKLSLSELQKEVENRSLLLSTFYSSGVFIGHYLHGGHLSCKNKQIVAILKHPLTSILQTAISKLDHSQFSGHCLLVISGYSDI